MERVLREAWQAEDVLTNRQKQLIQHCLPADVLEGNERAPTSEADLNNLHRVLSACDTIKEFEERIPGEDGNWLNANGIEFPPAIRRYIHNAACRFNHDDPEILGGVGRSLPEGFQASLRAFIMASGGHVATLNYDDLLYDCFTDTEVFYQRRLRDGFLNGRFDFSTHQQLMDPNREGWFFHLHGSPLFVNRQNEPCKITRAQLGDYMGNESSHLVLTSVRHKRAVIQSSEILKAYWSKLGNIVPTCSNVVLLGYGGEDTHLNDLLLKLSPEAHLRIVEYDDGAEELQRVNFWRDATGKHDIDLIRLPNVLSFRQWQPDEDG